MDAKVKALFMYRGVMRPYPHPRSAEAIEGYLRRRKKRKVNKSNERERLSGVFEYSRSGLLYFGPVADIITECDDSNGAEVVGGYSVFHSNNRNIGCFCLQPE